MVAGPQEDAGNARGLESLEERLVVRHHDRTVRRREVEEGVVRGTMALDRPVVPREALRGPRLAIGLGEDGQLREDGRRHRDVDVAEDAAQLGIQVDLELERHQERVGVEEDESGQRFRTARAGYLTMR